MRKTEKVVVQTEGRDKGKAFFITEMSAFKAEKWGLRALLALENSGFELPADVKGTGMAGIAALGVEKVVGQGAHLNFVEFEPLLDEMMECVQVIPNPQDDKIVRPLRDQYDDIEEVSTILQLRREVLLLHLGFLPAAVQSTLRQTLTTGAASSEPKTSP